MSETVQLAVESRVKEYLKSKDMRTSGELLAAVNNKIQIMLNDAVTRATSSGRKTVEPYDL